jgi:hypothetical protein
MTSSSVRRAIERSALAILVAAVAPLGWAAVVTTAEQTLTFDTLTNTDLGSDTSIIRSGYGEFNSGTVHFGGFNWAAGAAPVGVANSRDPTLNPGAIGFANGAVSTPGGVLNVAYKRSSAASSTIASLSGKFVFRGAFFTAVFNPPDIGLPTNTVQTLTLQAVSGGDVVSQTITLNAFSPVALSVDWAGTDGTGIDSLVLTTNVTDGSTTFAPLQWVMDDFRYAVAVPEPSSTLYLLVGMGLLCAIGARRLPKRAPH